MVFKHGQKNHWTHSFAIFLQEIALIFTYSQKFQKYIWKEY